MKKLNFFIMMTAFALAMMVAARADSTLNERNWGLQRSIEIEPARRLVTKTNPVKVAIVDTGIDSTHPDFKGRLSKAGKSFVGHDHSLFDVHGHGTHVSGIVAAVAQANVTIIPVKYYSDIVDGSMNLAALVQAVNYAVDVGAKVINYSGGGPEFNYDEYLAILRAKNAGVLLVVAAGNERHNVDSVDNAYYPCSYRLENILCVTNITIQNRLAASANWGKSHVHVAAPGDVIYSTAAGGGYSYMSGTSQATAFVSGLAALAWSQNPSATYLEIKRAIMSSTDQVQDLIGKVETDGRINAYKTLLNLKKTQHFTIEKK